MKPCLLIILVLAGFYCFPQADSIYKIKARKTLNIPCIAVIDGMQGGKITIAETSRLKTIRVSGSCDYEILSYVFSFPFMDASKEIKCSGAQVSLLTQRIMQSLRQGQHFFFEKIIAKDRASGQTFTLPSLKFTIAGS